MANTNNNAPMAVFTSWEFKSGRWPGQQARLRFGL